MKIKEIKNFIADYKNEHGVAIPFRVYREHIEFLLSRIEELGKAIERHKQELDRVWNENVYLEDLFPNIQKANQELYEVLQDK